MLIRAYPGATVLLASYSDSCVYATVDEYCPESKGQNCRLGALWHFKLRKYDFLLVVLQQYMRVLARSHTLTRTALCV